MAAVAVIVAGVLFARDAPRAWRAIVFVPALLAGLGAFQVRARTCVALAARGRRNMDAGVVAIQDPDERSRVKDQARQVTGRALLTAAIVTAALVAWP